jgi:hypothetical protein
MGLLILYGLLLLVGYENRAAAVWSAISIGILVLIGSSFYFILRYLNASSRTDKEQGADLIWRLDQKIAQLEKLSQSFQRNGATTGLDQSQLEEIREALKKSIITELSGSALVTTDTPAIEPEPKAVDARELMMSFNETRERLLREMSNLSRRANLNLAFGTLTTILAGTGLVYIVLFTPLNLAGVSSSEYSWLVVAHYVPRLSLIIFAEVFAYFFLRLYKASLPDMKYYQNEITNVEMRLIALKAALAMEDKEPLKAVVGDLSKTERNFTLKAGETTIELEKLKHDSLDAKGFAESIVALLKAK